MSRLAPIVTIRLNLGFTPDFNIQLSHFGHDDDDDNNNDTDTGKVKPKSRLMANIVARRDKNNFPKK